jgi:hypothetical protein
VFRYIALALGFSYYIAGFYIMRRSESEAMSCDAIRYDTMHVAFKIYG